MSTKFATVTALPTGPRPITIKDFVVIAEDGQCRKSNEPDQWFDPRIEADSDRAEELCAGCPILNECREWALRTDEKHGIWGGTTPEQRAEILQLEQAVA